MLKYLKKYMEFILNIFQNIQNLLLKNNFNNLYIHFWNLIY